MLRSNGWHYQVVLSLIIKNRRFLKLIFLNTPKMPK